LTIVLFLTHLVRTIHYYILCGVSILWAPFSLNQKFITAEL